MFGLENVCVAARGRQIAKRLFLLKFNPRDDDDEFLYGDSELKESSLSKVPPALLADLVTSVGETPLLGLLAPSRRTLYSTRPKRNIIDILLTSSLACVRQLNRMSEFSNLPTFPTHPSHIVSHSLAFRSARQYQQTTTYSKQTTLLWTQLLHRPMTPRKRVMMRTRTRWLGMEMAVTRPRRARR